MTFKFSNINFYPGGKLSPNIRCAMWLTPELCPAHLSGQNTPPLIVVQDPIKILSHQYKKKRQGGGRLGELFSIWCSPMSENTEDAVYVTASQTW